MSWWIWVLLIAIILICLGKYGQAEVAKDDAKWVKNNPNCKCTTCACGKTINK